MDISLIPTSQLLEIRDFVKQEIKRRVTNPAFARDFLKEKKAYKFNYGSCGDSNYKVLAMPPHAIKSPLMERLKYLKHILKQDWSHLFTGGCSEEKYYVYCHSDPTLRGYQLPNIIGGHACNPFYVGKGTGQRAYNLRRSETHGVKLSSIKRMGYKKEDIVFIMKDNLTESKALELESKLIYFFGTIMQPERGRHSVLVNLDIPKTPSFKENEFINIKKKGGK